MTSTFYKVRVLIHACVPYFVFMQVFCGTPRGTPPATCWAPAGAAGRAMGTLTSLLTSSPLHVLLVEVFTRYLKNYGEWPAISRVCLLCVGLG